MESGLEDRNNIEVDGVFEAEFGVSMESGLEDRNNHKYIELNRAHGIMSQWSPA